MDRYLVSVTGKTQRGAFASALRMSSLFCMHCATFFSEVSF